MYIAANMNVYQAIKLSLPEAFKVRRKEKIAMHALNTLTTSSPGTLIHEALLFIDTGPGYVVTVIAIFLIWFAWRALMK